MKIVKLICNLFAALIGVASGGVLTVIGAIIALGVLLAGDRGEPLALIFLPIGLMTLGCSLGAGIMSIVDIAKRTLTPQRYAVTEFCVTGVLLAVPAAMLLLMLLLFQGNFEGWEFPAVAEMFAGAAALLSLLLTIPFKVKS